MARRYGLEVLAVVAILVFSVLFLYTGSTMKGADFAGSDTAGSGLIAQLSGKPAESFSPLIPQWQPPSAEIESCLFAFQAAIGGIFVGGVFGYWLGQRKNV
jgi:cobalt/nickel transport protein